ncbi:YheC/YheD family endospore coat-associated protein [Cytobacillus massiliigabonensis]|uniref:YheC/YheD family endospore coat-associated protein n=1 Tax=Cytobacillus massiliigabonensis TaxID=1871011 RepID=UPI000C849F7F|nr:YheC/YheD family protein [Cytobacillus massiliigabonensis]
MSIDLQNHHGPLIGILAGKGKNQSVIGNGPFFRELQREILKNGGISVVFTPDDIKEKTIAGVIYSPELDKWTPVTCPIPHIVFNRVPTRNLESTESFHKAFLFFQRRNIPFFNPGFLDKYSLFEWFSHDPILQPFLPDTIKITERTAFLRFLERYKTIYLKPAQGAKGVGIYKLCQQNNQTVVLFSLKDKHIFKDIQTFWKEWEQPLLEKNYIAQESVKPALIRGKRYDFRILAHFTEEGYQVTGAGIRQSGDQEITTHVLNGGCIIPYEDIQMEDHDQFFALVAERAGKILSKELGFFGEFSIDAGLSEDGKYVIYEINSKPMRFDEISIEKKRISSLVHLFIHLANRENLPSNNP